MGDFPVKFFGSNEYAWTTQGRTFLYEKGDSDKMPGGSANKKTLTQLFRRGLMEAADFFKEACLAKAKQGTKKPPTYQKIKTNRPYGDVPVYSDVSSEVQLCNCDHNSENPCHEDSDCINRLLMVECMMSTCPAKERCQNMQFQRRTYPSLRVSQTDSRGWGLFVDQAMKKGRFIIEYVGELITMDEFRNRLRKCSPENEDGEEENYYYMTMDSNRMIDAGPKGNIARFMNHSCDPNCETQKWTVNGDTRRGEVKKTCLCGAPNCSGYIGKKPAKTTQADPRVAKKPKTKKIKFIKAWEDTCFRCYKGGEVLMCDHKTCPKVYHLECLSRDSLPHGRWFCPWHHCVECGKSAVKYCVHCPNAYCRQHESNLEEHPSLKSLCNEHDPEDIDSLLSYYNSSENREMLTSPAAPMIPVSPSATALKRRRSKGGKRGRPPASVIEEPPKGKENFFKS
ncbi:Uncharacterized protein FKW44_009049 [Caligus rogercresseyi]|uniref:Histone-lysine N-methyltransferase NSD2 n=1 Tax=Caligus rogercresseyi TaxID=217165 RepID=A0A7T8K775_CALRO|nr:Uncharacterized protein FKW44_009049 [Caligus rogercresseyi]